MVTYKLIKKYPNLPIDWKLGMEIGLGDRNYGYSPCTSNYSDYKKLDNLEVENYPEFWELVVEKDYKVLSFELNKKIFKLDENKNKYFAEDGNYANYVEMLNDNKILSVKRLSNNTVFSIGDDTNAGVIKQFNICGNTLQLKVDGLIFLNDYLVKKVKQPLFTTEDGVDIFEGDTYWCVNTTPHLWSLFEQTSKEKTQLTKRVLSFSTKSLAETFILMNKPCLSINDVLTSQDGLVFAEKKLKELVKSK